MALNCKISPSLFLKTHRKEVYRVRFIRVEGVRGGLQWSFAKLKSISKHNLATVSPTWSSLGLHLLASLWPGSQSLSSPPCENSSKASSYALFHTQQCFLEEGKKKRNTCYMFSWDFSILCQSSRIFFPGSAKAFYVVCLVIMSHMRLGTFVEPCCFVPMYSPFITGHIGLTSELGDSNSIQ